MSSLLLCKNFPFCWSASCQLNGLCAFWGHITRCKVGLWKFGLSFELRKYLSKNVRINKKTISLPPNSFFEIATAEVFTLLSINEVRLKGNRVWITSCRATVSSLKGLCNNVTDIRYREGAQVEQARRPAPCRFGNAFAIKSSVK